MNREEFINKKLKEHYECMLSLYPANRIVMVGLQGSQNYDMDDEDSDVDTKCIVTPSLDEIVMAGNSVSTTHFLIDGRLVYTKEEQAIAEHCDAKDIRLYWKTLLKSNINFVEILFTKYSIINPLYKDLWDKVLSIRESVARVNPLAAIKAMMGTISEKYFALTHRYPSREKWIDEFGYDSKQLHHLIRVYKFMESYHNGTHLFTYKDLVESNHLLPAEKERIKNIKRHGCGDLEAAQKIADLYYGLAKDLCDGAKMYYDGKDDEFIKEIMFAIMGEMVKLSIRKELE